jgi:hypothetical protein
MLPAFELLIPDFTLSRVMEEGYQAGFQPGLEQGSIAHPFNREGSQ